MFEVISALIVAAAVAWAGSRISRSLAPVEDEGSRRLRLMALFAPGLEAAAGDPRALLTWQPLAVSARKLFPGDFAILDQAAGGEFPFPAHQIQAAHSRWTSDWLAWERTHDTEYKLKAGALAQQLGDTATTSYGRSRLEALEQERLDVYQRRYEEYVRVGKALQALLRSPS